MNDLQKEFGELKNLYSQNETKRKYIIEKMRENLHKRTSKNIITTLDGHEYQIDSDDVTELYAIDGALSSQETSKIMMDNSDEQRTKLKSKNKYSAQNPYYDHT